MHVEEADSVHELVNECAEPEAAASNIRRLKTKSLGSTTTTDKRSAASRITVNVDEVRHCTEFRVLDEGEASVVVDVLGCATDLIHLSGVCEYELEIKRHKLFSHFYVAN